MTIYFTKIADSIVCDIPGRSANGKWRNNATNSVENRNSKVLESVQRLYSILPAHHIKSASCKSSALLKICSDVRRYKNKWKRVPLEQRAIYLSAEKTSRAKYKNKIIGTENSEINLKTDDDALIQHREIMIETPSLSPSIEVVDDKSAYRNLSRSQTYWLSIGENIGAWLIKKKTKP